MNTAGEILKKKRLEKKYTLEEIEESLKIRKKFLAALEENNWNNLPSLTYIKGFLRSYSRFLGLNPEAMVAFFRRQYQEQEKGGVIPDGLAHPLNEPPFRFTSQTAIIALIVSFFLFSFVYLFYQYKTITSPPFLTVTKPAEGEIITTDKVLVSGKTDSDAVVSINSQKIAVSQNGEFTTTLILLPGINTFEVISTSKFGKKKTITRTIQVQTNQ